MKGLLYQKLVLIMKVTLPGFIVLLIMAIGMEFMSSYIIDSTLESTSSIPIEVQRAMFTSYTAIIGFLFIFFSGSVGAGQLSAPAERKFNMLLCTWPVSSDEVVTTEYISEAFTHIIGLVAGVIYFATGYFIGLFANPLRDFWKIAVVLFFAAWLSKIIILPLTLAKVKTVYLLIIRLLLVGIPIGTGAVIAAISQDIFARMTGWLNSNMTVILIAVTALSCALTPVSYMFSKRYVKEKDHD